MKKVNFTKGIQTNKVKSVRMEKFLAKIVNNQCCYCELIQGDQFLKPYVDVDIKHQSELYQQLIDYGIHKQRFKEGVIQLTMKELNRVFPGKEIVYNDSSRQHQGEYKYSFHFIIQGVKAKGKDMHLLFTTINHCLSFNLFDLSVYRKETDKTAKFRFANQKKDIIDPIPILSHSDLSKYILQNVCDEDEIYTYENTVSNTKSKKKKRLKKQVMKQMSNQ